MRGVVRPQGLKVSSQNALYSVRGKIHKKKQTGPGCSGQRRVRDVARSRLERPGTTLENRSRSLHAHTHAQTHTHIIYMHTYIHTYIHTYMHTYILQRSFCDINTHTHTNTHTHIHTHTHTTYIHTYILQRSFYDIHTHTYTHTHTHTHYIHK